MFDHDLRIVCRWRSAKSGGFTHMEHILVQGAIVNPNDGTPGEEIGSFCIWFSFTDHDTGEVLTDRKNSVFSNSFLETLQCKKTVFRVRYYHMFLEILQCKITHWQGHQVTPCHVSRSPRSTSQTSRYHCQLGQMLHHW